MQQLAAWKIVYQARILMEFKEQLTIYSCFKVKTGIPVPEVRIINTIQPFRNIHAFIHHSYTFESPLPPCYKSHL